MNVMWGEKLFVNFLTFFFIERKMEKMVLSNKSLATFLSFLLRRLLKALQIN